MGGPNPLALVRRPDLVASLTSVVQASRSPRFVIVTVDRWRLLGQTSPAHHILGNAGLPDIDPEPEQFAMNARRAPQRIGDAHLPD